MPIFQLTSQLVFPNPSLADRNGLLAIGGDLTPKRLLLAYQHGIFPWYSDEEPILWWSPNPRLVLFLNEFHASRSLKKLIRKQPFHITLDKAFQDVIQSCADVRIENHEGTWIIPDMTHAYCQLHKLGFAHSVEVWDQNANLVGGIYGVSLGRSFFGESMFTRVSNASKVALYVLVDYLKQKSFDFIDCQVKTSHLMRFGAREISRNQFLNLLAESLKFPSYKGLWHLNCDSSDLCD
ncbi:MAG: leucyl/phenylalanyl-tRNA--protein transferase [Desulfobacterales bacterium]|nr:leucyl/phenylalanyl-tRNA--protein transferase [Desulfobacterales bacterium]